MIDILFRNQKTLTLGPPVRLLCLLVDMSLMIRRTIKTLPFILLKPQHSAYAAEKLTIGHQPATHQPQAIWNMQLSSSGGPVNLSTRLVNTSVFNTMLVDTAMLHLPATMGTTAALSVWTPTMVAVHAHATDLRKVLYIVKTPYIASAWKDALDSSNLTCLFPNLVHDIAYGSPIGNPPPLNTTFILKNLGSADLHPEMIDKELLEETSAGRMSGLFTPDEARIIFDGHFCTSPVGLVEKVPGDGNWRMIHYLSKSDSTGFSTNDALDSDNFPTIFYSAAFVANWVSLSYTVVILRTLGDWN